MDLASLENGMLNWIVSLMHAMGGWGIFIGMFLESSFVPIPAELVLVAAGALGFSPWEVAFWGTLGSTLGSILGYYIGKIGGRPVLDKIGPYLLVTPDKVEKAEKACIQYGGKAILVSRLIPFVPYKIFSITAGVLKFDLKTFVIYTFIGTIPRAFLLAWIGTQIIQYQAYFYYFMAGIIVAGLLGYYLNKKYKWF